MIKGDHKIIERDVDYDCMMHQRIVKLISWSLNITILNCHNIVEMGDHKRKIMDPCPYNRLWSIRSHKEVEDSFKDKKG